MSGCRPATWARGSLVSVPPNGLAGPRGNLKCFESLPGPPVALETLQQMSSWLGNQMQSEADIVSLRGYSPSPWSGVEQQPFLVPMDGKHGVHGPASRVAPT